MKEQVRGFQISFLAHMFVISLVWAFSVSAVTVSRPIEIDFGMVKEEAPSEFMKPQPVKKERTRPVAQPRTVEQPLTPAHSESAAPVAPPKLAETFQRPPASAGSSASVNREPVDYMPFGGVMGPNFLHREIPEYPFMARRMNKEGKVVLRLTIDERGRLLSTEVVEGAGFGFTDAALVAVKKSTYRPAKRDGIAVMSRAILPVRFELKSAN
ncbi:MAG: periplasmic protein TonB [Nitrospirae bacterium]|nr:MAG: periplasmic protein TonB [Nitrospirota bacterium]